MIKSVGQKFKYEKRQRETREEKIRGKFHTFFLKKNRRVKYDEYLYPCFKKFFA